MPVDGERINILVSFFLVQSDLVAIANLLPCIIAAIYNMLSLSLNRYLSGDGDNGENSGKVAVNSNN